MELQLLQSHFGSCLASQNSGGNARCRLAEKHGFARLNPCGLVASVDASPTLKGSAEGAEYKRLLRESRVARALRDVAGALGASLELDELLELVLGKLTDLLASDRAMLFLLDERKRELVSRSAGGEEDYPVRVPLNDGVLSTVVRTGRALRVDDFSASEWTPEWEQVLAYETRCALAAPLKNNLSRTIGVLLVLNKKGEETFSEDDAEILSVLAKQAAIAIDNSRLLVTLIRKNQQLQQAQEQLTRRVRDLELLFDLERNTAHAHSHEELARAVLESLAKACSAGGALLVLAEDSPSEYIDYSLTRSARFPGQTREPPAEFRSTLSPRDGILAQVIHSSTPIQLDSMDSPLVQEGLPEVHSMIAEPLEGEEQVSLGALALINKRGGPFTAEDLGLLRLVSANLSTAVRLFNTKQVREKEERLSSIGRLLSQVVHDLKSPLTVISGYVQLMEESSERATRQRYAAEILKQFKALGAMQREVLAFARGETQVFARRVIMDRLLSDVAEQMRPELSEKGVELKISAVPKLIAHLDSERITRALQNLIRNAAEAMAPLGGGVVRVRADADGETLTLRVWDTGPGIPASIAPRLFQSFVTAGKAEGTGLGLAIVKRIVEEHGGSVKLAQVPRGACFLMTLPGAIVTFGASDLAVDEVLAGGNTSLGERTPERSASVKKTAAKKTSAKKVAKKTPLRRAPKTNSPKKKPLKNKQTSRRATQNKPPPPKKAEKKKGKKR